MTARVSWFEDGAHANVVDTKKKCDATKEGSCGADKWCLSPAYKELAHPVCVPTAFYPYRVMSKQIVGNFTLCEYPYIITKFVDNTVTPHVQKIGCNIKRCQNDGDCKAHHTDLSQNKRFCFTQAGICQDEKSYTGK